MHSTPRYLFATAAAFGVLVAVASAADPTIVPGNPSCADLDSSYAELKYDGGDAGTHDVTDGTVSATITIDPGSKTASFEASPGIDAVIIKAGNQANVYRYDADTTSASGLETGSKAQISHVSLCYGPTPGGGDTPSDDGGDHPGGGGGGGGGDNPDAGGGGENHANGGGRGTPTTPAGTQQQQSPPNTTSGDRIEVLGESVSGTAVRGRSVLHGPSRCVRGAFTVRVTGRRIAKVTFFIDGRRVKARGRKLRIRPARYGSGVHRIQALVRYTAASGTPARRHRMVFQRCARQSVLPQFTG